MGVGKPRDFGLHQCLLL
jgi:hypothetical protein